MLRKKIIKNEENRIHFIIFAITMLVAIAPLISRYCINGHDLEYHLLRIESLKEGILIGKPFLKVNTLFFGGAGYASTMFYPDTFLHVPALLRVMGLSINASYHIYMAMIFVLCYGSTYICALGVTKSKNIASIAAVLLTLCPYHMDDMILRSACGEYSAFVFAPFVIYGIYNVLFEEMDKPGIFVIGFAGLIITHPATLFMNVVLCAVLLLVYIKQFVKNPKLFVKLAVATVITLLLTAYQWAPMLEQFATARFGVEGESIDMLDMALQVRQIFGSSFPTMGMIFLVLAFVRIVIKKEKGDNILAYADALAIMAFITAIGAANIWPWARLARLLSFMQFPWRLFGISSVLFAFADAIYVFYFAKKLNVKSLDSVVVLVLMVSVAFAIPHYAELSEDENGKGYYDYGTDYYSYKPYTANVIGGEWIPDTVTDRESILALSEHMMLDNGNEANFTREKGKIRADIKEDSNYVDVPFIYYKGYKAELKCAAGNKQKLRVTGEGINGMCRVYTEGQQGELTIWYGNTAVINVSNIISLIALVGCTVIIYKKRITMKKS